MTAWIKVAPRHDILGVERSYQFVAAETGGSLIDFKDDVLIIVLLRFVIGYQR